MNRIKNKINPAVIGLGYVGLPIFLRLNKTTKRAINDKNFKVF